MPISPLSTDPDYDRKMRLGAQAEQLLHDGNFDAIAEAFIEFMIQNWDGTNPSQGAYREALWNALQGIKQFEQFAKDLRAHRHNEIRKQDAKLQGR